MREASGGDPITTDIPRRNEPDPKALRMRSFQGGTDSLPDPPPPGQTYDDLKRLAGAGKMSTTNQTEAGEVRPK